MHIKSNKIIGITFFLIAVNILSIFFSDYIQIFSLLNMLVILYSASIVFSRFNDVKSQEEISESFLRISDLLTTVNSKEELYTRVLEEIVNHVSSADKASLISTDKNGKLHFEAVVGFNLEAAKKLNLKLRDTYLFKAIDNQIPKSIVIDNIALQNKALLDADDNQAMDEIGIQDIKSTVCVPITFNKEIYGMINIDTTRERTFSSEDIEVIEAFSVEISRVIMLYNLFEKNREISKFDGLTGLYNREVFLEKVSELLQDSKEDHNYIVYFDIESLRRVNETYGYDIGDTFINYFVKALREHIYIKEILSRFVSDEFVLFYSRSDDDFDAFIQQVQTWFNEKPFIYKDQKIHLSFNYGIAKFSKDSNQVEELIRIAEIRRHH